MRSLVGALVEKIGRIISLCAGFGITDLLFFFFPSLYPVNINDLSHHLHLPSPSISCS